MTQYTLVQRNRGSSEFVESQAYAGVGVTASSRQTSVKKSGVTAVICQGKLTYTAPFNVTNGDLTAEFQGSLALSFNVERGDVATLDAYHAEIDRLFAAVKRDLVFGTAPSSLPASA